MNSLKLWLTLRVHGRQGYEEHIDRQMRLAQGFANWITSSDLFELAAPQTLPIVAFRLKGIDPSKTAASHIDIVGQVTRDGRLWISDTIVNGESAMRMMVISYLTEQRHLDQLQQALVAAARKLPVQTTSR